MKAKIILLTTMLLSTSTFANTIEDLQIYPGNYTTVDDSPVITDLHFEPFGDEDFVARGKHSYGGYKIKFSGLRVYQSEERVWTAEGGVLQVNYTNGLSCIYNYDLKLFLNVDGSINIQTYAPAQISKRVYNTSECSPSFTRRVKKARATKYWPENWPYISVETH